LASIVLSVGVSEQMMATKVVDVFLLAASIVVVVVVLIW